MPSEQLHVLYDASNNFTSESWEVMPTYPGRPLRQGSLQAIWPGLDALTGTLELEVSNDNVNWNCYGGVVEVTMTPAVDNQIYEFQKFMSRYVRVKYTKNTVTTGTINHLILSWSYAHPMVPFIGGILSRHFWWRIRENPKQP